jgi:predicted nucleic acid-binding protein
MALFVDSGYWIALESADDRHHAKALSYWQSRLENLPRLVTTSYILAEVVTFFNRYHHAKALELGEVLLESSLIEMVHVDEALFAEAWQYFVQHKEKRYSLTDCVSFVLMRQRKISTALTFDGHFRQAGYQTLPDLA